MTPASTADLSAALRSWHARGRTLHVSGRDIFVVDEGRGLVVAVNKWDAVEEKTGRTFDQYVEWIRNEAPFLDFAPIVSISATLDGEMLMVTNSFSQLKVNFIKIE